MTEHALTTAPHVKVKGLGQRGTGLEKGILLCLGPWLPLPDEQGLITVLCVNTFIFSPHAHPQQRRNLPAMSGGLTPHEENPGARCFVALLV